MEGFDSDYPHILRLVNNAVNKRKKAYPTYEIGFNGKGGVPIRLGDKARTFDRYNNEWVGFIVALDAKRCGKNTYAFKSNYPSTIHEYWSHKIEVLNV